MTFFINERRLLANWWFKKKKTELIKIYKIFPRIPNTVFDSSILKKIGLIGTISSFYPMGIKNVLLWYSIYFNGFSIFVSVLFNV